MIALLFLFLSHSPINMASAAKSQCESNLEFSPAELRGALMLHQRDPKLSESPLIRRFLNDQEPTVRRRLSQPEARIAAWLRTLDDQNSVHADRAERWLLNEVLTKTIAEAFFTLQARIARERGEGEIGGHLRTRQRLEELALADQRASLITWLDYLKEERDIPAWIRFWILNGVVKLSQFDKQKGVFKRRSQGQASLFPELNREALGRVVHNLTHVRRLESGFAQLYAAELLKVTALPADWSSTRGRWVRYPRGSDASVLVSSLNGMNTGWCTAGRSTAETQLAGGDFHVYYSEDRNGVARIPRAAIRMEGAAIREVRGVAPRQHLDEAFAASEILAEKLKTFGSAGERYLTAADQMKRLTEIDRRNRAGVKLSPNDLRLLYEVDGPIQSFGYQRDPRIKEIIGTRDSRRDLSEVLHPFVLPHEISLEGDEHISSGIKYHHGNLKLRITRDEAIQLPMQVSGDLIVETLDTAAKIDCPRRVGGSVRFRNLRTVGRLILPEEIGGYIDLDKLRGARELIFPERYGHGIHLPKLKSVGHLKLPGRMLGNLRLNALKTYDSIIFPGFIGGDLVLGRLEYGTGLRLPRIVGGKLGLNNLRSLDGIELPDEVGADLLIWKVNEIKGVRFPKIGGLIYPSIFRSRVLMPPLETIPDLDSRPR